MCILCVLTVHFCLVNDIAMEPIKDMSNLDTKIEKIGLPNNTFVRKCLIFTIYLNFLYFWG